MVRIDLQDPGDLIVAIPHLLGFYPTDSLIVLALSGPAASQITAMLRVDLPLATHDWPLAHQLLHEAAQMEAAAVILVVVSRDREATDAPPEEDFVHAFDHLAEAERVPLLHAFWTPEIAEGSSWHCYGNPGCGGTLGATDTTPVAAAAVMSGRVTFGSYDELAALLTPDDETALARRANLITQLTNTDTQTTPQNVQLVRDATEQMAGGQFAPSDEQVARLAVALSDHVARDACLRPPDGDQAAAEQLWLTLTRAMPTPHRAEPAVLLALAAYLRGSGVLASIALDVAEQADPDHYLAELTRAALDVGLPPDHLAALIDEYVAVFLPPGAADDQS